MWFFVRALGTFSLLGLVTLSTGPAGAVPEPGNWLKPPPRRREELPPPEPEAREHARLPLELHASLATIVPHCVATAAPFCSEAGPGLELGARWRTTPYLAIGANVGAGRFGNDSQSGHDRALLLGLAARAYFAESGSFDPFLELGFGAGDYARAVAGGRQTGRGLILEGSAGFEWWLTDTLRAGPSLSWLEILLPAHHYCSGGACRPITGEQSGRIARFIRIGIELTLAFGEPM